METLTSVTPTTVTDSNSALSPESPVTPKQGSKAVGLQGGKSQLQIFIESGGSYRDASEKFEKSEAAIRQAASRGRWITPRQVARVTRAVAKHLTPSVIGAIASEEAEKFVRKSFDVAAASLLPLKKIKIKGAKDFETIVRVGRRAAGLENDDDGAHASILLLNESIERAGVAVEPIEAHATLQPDDPVALTNEAEIVEAGLPASDEVRQQGGE